MDLTPLIASFSLFALMEFGDKDPHRGHNPLHEEQALARASLVTVMELGDKTQFTSFVLAARYGNPLMVFAGIMLGSALITGSGVVIGKALMRFVPERYLRYIAAALFLIFGAIFLASAMMGIQIL